MRVVKKEISKETDGNIDVSGCVDWYTFLEIWNRVRGQVTGKVTMDVSNYLRETY